MCLYKMDFDLYIYTFNQKCVLRPVAAVPVHVRTETHVHQHKLTTPLTLVIPVLVLLGTQELTAVQVIRQSNTN